MPLSSLVDRGNALLAAGKTRAAIELMTAAAERGDGDALYQLGIWRVWGHPLSRDFSAARDLFEQAGRSGHATGALRYAVFVAIGAGGEARWTDALRLLGDTASTDHSAAQQQNLISAMLLTEAGAPATIAEAETLAQSPRVLRFPALFTREECDHVRRLSAPLLIPSVVVDPATHRQIPHPVRTSDGTVLGPLQQDLVIEALNRRIAAATATRAYQGEPLAVMRYAPGQQYRLHHDCLPGELNQRGLTCIVYLNDGYEGGATHFPDVGQTIRGRAGDAIVFTNILTNGHADERTRHAGLPVTNGEKWICTRWIRVGDFDPWGMRQSA